MPMSTALFAVAQAAALVLIGLVAGSMFGIWRGYDATQYSPATFVEVQQGAVRGLNTLLPAMAIAALLLVVGLAIAARARPGVLWLYLIAAVGIAAGGLVTRFANQPINAEIMQWSAASLPPNWTALRDSWWSWHLVRLATTLVTEVVLIAAVFADRNG